MYLRLDLPLEVQYMKYMALHISTARIYIVVHAYVYGTVIFDSKHELISCTSLKFLLII
jgi:hypothetical protein